MLRRTAIRMVPWLFILFVVAFLQSALFPKVLFAGRSVVMTSALGALNICWKSTTSQSSTAKQWLASEQFHHALYFHALNKPDFLLPRLIRVRLDHIRWVLPEYDDAWRGEYARETLCDGTHLCVPYGILLLPIGAYLVLMYILTRRTIAGFCKRCGYDLRATSTGRCPECGLNFDPNAFPVRFPPLPETEIGPDESKPTSGIFASHGDDDALKQPPR